MNRPYHSPKRASQAAATRQKIVDAVVELHRSVGPRETTITEVARRAGVERLTVYKHFPDEAGMVMASQGHWLMLHPPPDEGRWASIRDPAARLGVALRELYAWYAETETMTENVLRDGPALPSFSAVLSLMEQLTREGADILSQGRVIEPGSESQLLATITLAMNFSTWKVLVKQFGLTIGEAVNTTVGWVASAQHAAR